MGITWSMEVLSFVIKQHISKEGVYAYIWYLPDALNALYGVIIFIIFGLKTKVGFCIMHDIFYGSLVTI